MIKAAVRIRILGYLAALEICALFALYMSAAVGWTFFYILAAAPLFSFIITAVTAWTKSIEISTDVNSNTVYKNQCVRLKVTVKNKSFFPVPAAEIRLNGCEGFTADKKNLLCSLSVLPRSSAELEVNFRAEMWGAVRIGIESVSLSDFLHFISVPLYKETGWETYSHTVKVFPNIPDVPSDTPLIKSAAETIRFADDCEDTKETDGFNMFGGMPGYTHREYIEGDPIKRINWKLSSKKDIYMVRLDDETEAMQQVIVLDSKGGSKADNERAVEGLLAAVFSLFRLGFESTVWLNTKDGFVPADISDYGDVVSLQTMLADYSFTNDPAAERIPAGRLAERKQSGGIMLFSPMADFRLASAAEAAGKDGTAVTAVIAGENCAIPAPYWILNADCTARLIS